MLNADNPETMWSVQLWHNPFSEAVSSLTVAVVVVVVVVVVVIIIINYNNNSTGIDTVTEPNAVGRFLDTWGR